MSFRTTLLSFSAFRLLSELDMMAFGKSYLYLFSPERLLANEGLFTGTFVRRTAFYPRRAFQANFWKLGEQPFVQPVFSDADFYRSFCGRMSFSLNPSASFLGILWCGFYGP